MKWTEVIRKLKAAGYVEERTAKGAHRIFVLPSTGRRIVIAYHGHDAGQLGNRILKDAGLR